MYVPLPSVKLHVTPLGDQQRVVARLAQVVLVGHNERISAGLLR